MNWEIKEFTMGVKSLRKDLALLVKHGNVRTGVLPRALVFALHSHLTIHPPLPQAYRLHSTCYIEANAAQYR